MSYLHCPYIFPLYGKGSHPPFEKGLQRNIRHIVKIKALIILYFKKACFAYSEQDG
jgi:hypothetical protein